MGKYNQHNRSGWFAFDTESGGLDPKDNSLLTLAGVIVDDKLQPLVKPINLKIKHEVYKITAKAMEINKINLVEHNKTAITIEAAGKELSQYLFPFTEEERLGVIGQYVEHDKNFVLESGLLRSWDRFFSREVLDTKRIADYLKFSGILPKELSTSLVCLAEYFHISTDNAHDAEHDLWMTLQVLNELRSLTLGGKK